MRVVVAGDSAGRGLASLIAKHLSDRYDVTDDTQSSDQSNEYYANLSDRIANSIIDKTHDRGILICGTGIGVSIASNKVPGIRAALCHDTYSAERASLSNNAQIITMGARVIGPELAKAIADVFLSHTFDEQGPSADNVRAINAVDFNYNKPL